MANDSEAECSSLARTKGKGKVVPVLLTECHAIEAYGGMEV